MSGFHKLPSCLPKLLDGTLAIPFDIIRIAVGRFDKTTGIYIRGPQEEFSAKGSIQPLSGREVLQLVEADRKKEQINVWTVCKLKLNDIVICDDKRFEVQNVENWGEYTKSRAALIDEDDQRNV